MFLDAYRQKQGKNVAMAVLPDLVSSSKLYHGLTNEDWQCS